METLILIIHIIAIFLLIVLVLLQQGKGTAAGVSFGGGASNTMFGSQGSFSFLMKLTYATAFTFFMTSLMLTYFSYQKSQKPKNLLAPKSTQTIPVSPQKQIEKNAQ